MQPRQKKYYLAYNLICLCSKVLYKLYNIVSGVVSKYTIFSYSNEQNM